MPSRINSPKKVSYSFIVELDFVGYRDASAEHCGASVSTHSKTSSIPIYYNIKVSYSYSNNPSTTVKLVLGLAKARYPALSRFSIFNSLSSSKVWNWCWVFVFFWRLNRSALRHTYWTCILVEACPKHKHIWGSLDRPLTYRMRLAVGFHRRQSCTWL